MCHAARVKLSLAEKKAVRKLSGVLIPIYASAVLVLLAVITLTHVPRSNHVPRSIDAVASVSSAD